jgi:hypothetical protein
VGCGRIGLKEMQARSHVKHFDDDSVLIAIDVSRETWGRISPSDSRADGVLLITDCNKNIAIRDKQVDLGYAAGRRGGT